MTTTTVGAAIRAGATRGASLALNPSIENYKRIRSTWKDPTRAAWFSVGASLSTAMDTERRSQESRSSN
ncbi:hypothetical protein [Actinomyces gerencseriae]|uniref:hypothetical protein n=1 Tax=Actinomyces gerencseriae TaxID=52769 RepID=UPI0028EFD3CE|nr:hypothetical protein [Actinomyces gerencseriae]